MKHLHCRSKPFAFDTVRVKSNTEKLSKHLSPFAKTLAKPQRHLHQNISYLWSREPGWFIVLRVNAVIYINTRAHLVPSASPEALDDTLMALLVRTRSSSPASHCRWRWPWPRTGPVCRWDTRTPHRVPGRPRTLRLRSVAGWACAPSRRPAPAVGRRARTFKRERS